MGYIIGSFDTHNLGHGNHDINLIADIIFSERFDIVALQEVIKPELFDSLRKRLYGWDGQCDKPGNSNQGFGSKIQGFGYLWNTKRVRLCDPPIIFSEYKDIPSKYSRMIRNPYYARFTPSGTPGGAFFEIRLINIHLKAILNNSNDKRRTVDEFKKITGEILRRIGDQRYGNNMPAYTIILGDHNLLCVECNEINQQPASGIVTKQEEKTWISNDDNPRYYSDLDHFSYEEVRFNGTTVRIERVDSVSKYCQNNFKEHREIVSDHVPIKLDLILN
jgi:endonuclease/exonuclease/phosphatase family metal-dependent hydrolase